jgi:hypothetical protein
LIVISDDANPVAGTFDRTRLEGKLRVALGVEELGRLEMGFKIRVFGLGGTWAAPGY